MTGRRNPQGPRTAVVNCHGRGWTVGGLAASDWPRSLVGRDLNIVVVSVDYRLAPGMNTLACNAGVRFARGAVRRRGCRGDDTRGGETSRTGRMPPPR
ncbi:alpha/beta hydrolase fold domain-containing protein [Nocardia sp. NPDC005366]|uniref:alpha/beta hydrolase fold domain-containing protein n=1 Tax=Nocardia sp. NPDC005366 TaxID=3156878 RepID=UPI0033AC2E4C